ncbi:unnamed protein product [Rotaria socialis]|uniref:Uncharacterized protein n=1 Tax=Rotaria socialis TaxID=392032 RepID=A0A817YYC0_9BILA|nr:unnamed protein product [Rotaria socialis]CAF3383856.1 unnamed protein product [Rotaria socialis]CAF4357091.1 unnamed protein product [Rotaria socialis]CAF4395352.1 unnamed protein product [Rotaria socialis]
MIFNKFSSKLLENIDITIEYYIDEIEINVKWASKKELSKSRISFKDDECTLPLDSPLFYLCSSSTSKKQASFNSTFYSYWFLLDTSLYQRLFSHIVIDEDHFVLLICLSDGRIVALPESSKDSKPIIWHTSLSTNPITILGLYYDLNRNLLDAVLCSTADNKFPKLTLNHLILCESIGSIILINSTNLRRILLDNLIKSPCIYLHNFIYITKNEIRSIAIANLLKLSNEDFISQTKTLRFGHFLKLIVDGQEIIIYYDNGRFERVNNLLPNASNPIQINSLSNQTKRLACLTATITNLQANVCLLQRIFHKIEIFYQLNLNTCLKLVNNQWKLILNDQQLRIFQLNDFILILICNFSSNNIKIYQLNSINDWIFKISDTITSTYICQPILIFRHQNQVHFQVALKKIIVPLQEQIQQEQISLENYFTNKFKAPKLNNLSIQQYHLAFTIRNDAAKNFQKLNMNLARRLLIGQTDVINIECKQQEMKVDTDEGLVDSLTLQIILSSSCLRRLIIIFSTITELFYGNKSIEEKNFIKQTDVAKIIDVIQEAQTKLSSILGELKDDLLLDLLQIRIYLSLFRLGSNYSVQVY